MKPLVAFGDALAAATDVIRAGLASRTEQYAAGARVVTKVPGDRTSEADLPLVLVADDGTFDVVYPADAAATIRITVWHRSTGEAVDLAQLARAVLAVHTGSVLRSVIPRTGPDRATDDATGIDLATCTATVHIKPAAI